MDGGALRKFWQEPLKRYQDPALRAWLEMLFSHLRGTNFYITYYLTLYIFFSAQYPKRYHKGCLPFVRIHRLERPLDNGKVFPKSANQPKEMALTICNLISSNCFRLMIDWKLERLEMVRKFSPFRSERKKRTSSGGSIQFPNGFSGILLFHLTCTEFPDFFA